MKRTMRNKIFGHNEDPLYKGTGSGLLDFFSKAGSLYENTRKTSYYGGETPILDLFKKAWKEDELLAMKLLFWLRDIRG